MTGTNDHRIGRRPVLKGAGASFAALGGLASPVAARKGNKGRGNGRGRGGKGGAGRKPLEDSPSLVANLIFSSQVPPELPPFGYPDFSVLRTFDPGMLFDTTSAEITPNGQVIHYQLQFGAESKPYVLTHEGDGRYVSRGSVINFELDEFSDELNLPAGKYRATVRDLVRLYGKGGYFDWSVTRTDIFARPGMVYAGSSLIIVWDEDGMENDNPRYRNNPTKSQPEFSPDQLGEGTYNAIDQAAQHLINAGPSNPGGR